MFINKLYYIPLVVRYIITTYYIPGGAIILYSVICTDYQKYNNII